MVRLGYEHFRLIYHHLVFPFSIILLYCVSSQLSAFAANLDVAVWTAQISIDTVSAAHPLITLQTLWPTHLFIHFLLHQWYTLVNFEGFSALALGTSNTGVKVAFTLTGVPLVADCVEIGEAKVAADHVPSDYARQKTAPFLPRSVIFDQRVIAATRNISQHSVGNWKATSTNVKIAAHFSTWVIKSILSSTIDSLATTVARNGYRKCFLFENFDPRNLCLKNTLKWLIKRFQWMSLGTLGKTYLSRAAILLQDPFWIIFQLFSIEGDLVHASALFQQFDFLTHFFYFFLEKLQLTPNVLLTFVFPNLVPLQLYVTLFAL